MPRRFLPRLVHISPRSSDGARDALSQALLVAASLYMQIDIADVASVPSIEPPVANGKPKN